MTEPSNPRTQSQRAPRPSARPSAIACCVSLLLPLALLPELAGCKKPAEPVATPEVYVQAANPTLGNISEEIEADATLAPLAQAAIAPKISAPVRTFYVQRGSRVRAGQLLATLENRDLAAAALDNRGQLEAAQGTYDTTTRATVQEDTTKAVNDERQAKAGLDLQQSIVNSRTQLLQQGAIPGRDLDTAKAALAQAQAAYDIARQHRESVQNVSRKAALENAQGTLTSAKGKYQGAAAQLSYTQIKSPISGVVTDRPLFAGETAAAGTAVITVMDTSAMLAKLHISSVQAQALALGDAAKLTVPGIDDPVSAKVSLISPALDPGSTTIEVWLRVENRNGALKVGSPVHAVIEGRTVHNAILLPTDAIQPGAEGAATGKAVMIMASDGTAHKKAVTLGIQTPEITQILTGVGTGDTVITTGGYGLDENTRVKIGTAPDEKKDPADAKGAPDDKSAADDKKTPADDKKPAAAKDKD